MKKNYSIIISSLLFCGGEIFSQNISINTTGAANSTSSMLEVLQPAGAASGAKGLHITNAGTGVNAYAIWAEATGATNRYAMVVPSGGGSVGIGTTTPIASFQVGSSSQLFGDISTVGIIGGATSYPLTLVNTAGQATGNLNRLSFNFGSAGWSSTAFVGSIIENAATAATGLTFGTYNAGLTEKVRIDASGNVGVGTTLPSTKVEIDNFSDPENASANPLGAFSIKTTASTALVMGVSNAAPYEGWLQVRHGTVAGFTYPLSFQPLGGNVGIGTVAPNRKLEILTGIDGITFGQTVDNSQSIQTYIDGHYSDRVTYASGCCNFLFLQPDIGGVGIGPGVVGTSPTCLLQTSLSASGIIPMLYSSNLWPQFPRILQSVSASITTDNTVVATSAVVGLNFENSSTTDNTYSPLITFSRKSASGAYNPLYASIGGICTGNGADANWTKGDLVFGTTDYAGPLERMRIRSDGYIGIGTSSPICKLHVVGKIKTDAMKETSDRRLKKNIVTIDNALAKVEQLRGVYFNWRADEFKDRNFETTTQLGVIAQEIEKIIPEVVATDGDGYKSVEYSKLVAVLIEAIKEQQKTIEGLTFGMTDMKTANLKQQKELETIKADYESRLRKLEEVFNKAQK